MVEYSCGGTALACNDFGKGKVYTWGFPVFQIFRKAKTTADLESIREIFRKTCAESGVVSDLKISGDENFQLQTGVLCQNDNRNGNKICFLINFSDRELNCNVELPAFTSCREVFSSSNITENKFELKFAPYETMAFLITV